MNNTVKLSTALNKIEDTINAEKGFRKGYKVTERTRPVMDDLKKQRFYNICEHDSDELEDINSINLPFNGDISCEYSVVSISGAHFEYKFHIMDLYKIKHELDLKF